ncbi:MAG TPA: OsmC family protein [Myxococcota bacterium]|nr:OsmC family protein [Myxococcota bacterium]
MKDLPHVYSVSAAAAPEGDVSLTAEGLAPLASAPPVEFGGPGGRWSPETLLVAAVADCFVLSFRALATASKLAWSALDVRANGTLDKVERATRFTRVDVRAVLTVPAGTDTARAERLLERAEQICFISNSLACPRHLEASVELGDGS